MFVFLWDSLVPNKDLAYATACFMWSFSMYLHVCDAFESSVLLLDLGETGHWAQKSFGWVAQTDV